MRVSEGELLTEFYGSEMLVSRSDRSRSSVERASVTKRDIERDREIFIRLQDIQRTVLGAHTQLTARHSAYTRCTLHTHALSLHSTRARAALKSRRAPLPLGFMLVDEIL